MNSMGTTRFDRNVLSLDCEGETQRICRWLVESVARLGRRGVVVAISGGVDSAVCAALAARAFGRPRVLGLLLPERDSSSASSTLGRKVAEQVSINFLLEDIAPALEAIGCYQRRDTAMRVLFPEYDSNWKSKIVIASSMGGKLHYFKLVVQAPDGTVHEKRLPLKEYLEIVSATSFKQRIRKTLEYFHADRLNYAVIGTPNRLEYDQGFFVKNGDGAADAKPIAHLYKTQVYQLAEYLGVPEEIRRRPPTTDTYSLSQSQEEFYFSLPYDKMDLCLYGKNHDMSPADVAHAAGLTREQVEYVYGDIASKRRATRYQHLKPLLVEPISELSL
jgi:NAD+ synthase